MSEKASDLNKDLPNHKRPVRAVLAETIPHIVKSYGKGWSVKTEQTERNQERPWMYNARCQHHYLAYLVCGRNMQRRKAWKDCAHEKADYFECMDQDGYDARQRKLEKASKKVGDSVPFVNGKGLWVF